jgi:uncharacterized membrane protein YhaH (DUF805 family)
MRRVFAGLAILLMLAVVVQFYFAASGSFSTAPHDEAFQPHRTMGYVVFFLAAVLTLVAALARMPGRLIGMSGLVAGLIVVQVLIALLADAVGENGDVTRTAGQLVFGLHAVNGLVIAAVAGRIARQALGASKPPIGPPAVPGHVRLPRT